MGPWRDVSRKAWTTATRRQGEHEQVEEQERAQDLWRDDPRKQTRRRLRVEQEQAEQDRISEGMTGSADPVTPGLIDVSWSLR